MQHFPIKFTRAVVDHPWPTIIGFVLVTALLASGLPRLYIEPDTRKILPQHHPDMIFENWARDFFGIEPPAVIMVANDGPEGVFTPETLALVQFITERMQALPLLHGEDIVSLAAVDNITANGDTLEVEPFFDEAPATLSDARRIREAVFANPMIPGNIVSLDGKATMILGEGLPGVSKPELYDALLGLVADAPVVTERITIAGRPVIEGEMGRIAQRDIARMFPLVITSVAVLLGLTLRSIRGVVLPLLVVFTSVLWTFGLMGWVQAPVHAISSIMPSLLIAIGVADGIHIVHHFLLRTAARPNDSARDITFDTMREMFGPVVMTSVTTAAGFLSIAVSSLESMQVLGTFIAIGVVSAMIFSLTILPATLCVLPLPHRAAARAAYAQRSGGHVAGRFMAALARITTRRPRWILVSAVVVTLAAAAGIPRIFIEASLINNFPDGNIVRVADYEIRSHFTGSTPLEIVLDGREVDAWKDPVRLRALVGMQTALEAYAHLGSSRSIADYILRMNQVMNPTDPNAHRIPDSRDLVAQYLLLYSISGDPDDLDDVVDYDYRYANVRVQIAGDGSSTIAETVAFVERYMHEHLAPMGIEGRVTGPAQTSNMFVSLIISSQIRSLIVGLFLVAAIAAVLSNSVAAGIFCLIPVFIATVMNFAILGWGGTALSVATVLVSSMGIGIGVDYAIHFVVRYRRQCLSGLEPEQAMQDTMTTSGVAIFYNALVVMVGFAVLSTSGFKVNAGLGYMAAINMAVCFTATVTVLAAALYYFQPTFTRPTE